MKNIWLVICIVLFCAPLPICAAERDVTGNTFQSSDPMMIFNIDPQFKYLGKMDDKRTNKRTKAIIDNTEVFVFGPRAQDRRVNKYVFIQIRERIKPFKDNAGKNEKNLDFNEIQIDGKPFQYYKRLISMPTDSLVVKLFSNVEHVIPACGMTNSFYTFPSANMIFSVNYVEDASPLGMTCQNHYSRDSLSENQKSYLGGFHKRAFASIGMGATEPTQQIPPTTATLSAGLNLKGKEDFSKKGSKADEAISVSRLSVFNFNATNVDAVQYGHEVTNLLTDALGNNQKFSIISRHDLQEFLRLNDLQQNDNLENLVSIGSRLGLNFIITGRVEKRGVTLSIECFVIDVHNEKVIFTRKVQAIGYSALAPEVAKMSDSIVAAIASQFAVVPQAAVAQTTFKAASTSYDGRWEVSIMCDDTQDKQGLVKGYKLTFFVDVNKGSLAGENGKIGQPGYLTLAGDIMPDGTVEISANGLTGDPRNSVGRVKAGSPYAYRIRGKFTKTSGKATRIGRRSCQVTFIKQ